MAIRKGDGTDIVICKGCFEPKPTSEFFIRADKVNIRRTCKQCDNERRKMRYHNAKRKSVITNPSLIMVSTPVAIALVADGLRTSITAPQMSLVDAQNITTAALRAFLDRKDSN